LKIGTLLKTQQPPDSILVGWGSVPHKT